YSGKRFWALFGRMQKVSETSKRLSQVHYITNLVQANSLKLSVSAICTSFFEAKKRNKKALKKSRATSTLK
ncbi:MAG TPA: hypothetical protein PKL31_18355, partial [Fulvivirga sp.]|nr:hypothetical protein [Fulvivirga sp.]